MAFGDRLAATLTDTFDTAIDDPPWNNNYGQYGEFVFRTGGFVGPNASIACVMRDDTNTYDADQYATITIGQAQVANGLIGGAVRVQANGNHYAGMMESFISEVAIYELTGGSYGTPLAQTATGYELAAAGAILTTEVEGTTIRFGYDADGTGGEDELLATTDNTLTGGDPGIHGYQFDTTDSSATEFVGGDMGTTGVINPVTISDTITITDQSVQERLRDRVISDSASITDNLLRSALRPVTLTDSVSVVDLIISERLRQRISIDDIDVTDITVLERIRFRALLDTIEATDNIIAQYVPASVVTSRTLLDNLTVTDSAVFLRERLRVLTDVIDISDIDTVFRTFIITTLDEALSVTDQSVQERLHNRALTDQINATDSVLAARERNRILQDAIAVLDSVQATYVSGDNISFVTLSDSVSVTDSVISLRDRRRTLLDVAEIVDSVQAQYISGGVVVNFITLQESVAVIDAIETVRERNRELITSVVVTDAIETSATRDRLLSDFVTQIVDSVEAVSTRRRTTTDQLTVLDLLISMRRRYRTMSDNTNVIDSIIASYVTEVISPSVSVTMEVEPIILGIEEEVG